MHKDIIEFVSACPTCQQIKHIPRPPFGLLQPIAPPTAVSEDVTMDFITKLPAIKGQTVIMVVVHRFSKAAYFKALPTNFLTYKATELFIQLICTLRGFPKSIISNRDPIFISQFSSSFQTQWN